MLTSLLSLSLACAPLPPVLASVPPPVTSRCEGPDLVTRDHDHREVSRRFNGCLSATCEGVDLVSRDSARVEYRRQRFAPACVVARCEGADLVRRDASGIVHSRQSWSSACISASCEGSEWVVRDRQGFEVQRQFIPARCAPPPPVRLTQNEPWRFGLTAK